MNLKVAALRHGDNHKGPGKLLDPGLNLRGMVNVHSTTNQSLKIFKHFQRVAVISTGMSRATQTARILTDQFNLAGIETQSFGLTQLDAQTALDYIYVIQALRKMPEFCLRNALPVPQAAILITHAHNVVGHFLAKFIDPNYKDGNPLDAVFINYLNALAMQESSKQLILPDAQYLKHIQNMPNGKPLEEAFEACRQKMIEPQNGIKAAYAEMSIFDLSISGWSSLGAECGKHKTTITPSTSVGFSL